VVKVVNIAVKHRITLIPVAGKTSLEGQFLPPSCCNPPAADTRLPSGQDEPTVATRPSIQLSLASMDQILAIHPQDSQAVVQPGVGWQSLNEELAELGHKLFFPIDPAPGAQVSLPRRYEPATLLPSRSSTRLTYALALAVRR